MRFHPSERDPAKEEHVLIQQSGRKRSPIEEPTQ
jgi:hypothetical protein